MVWKVLKADELWNPMNLIFARRALQYHSQQPFALDGLDVTGRHAGVLGGPNSRADRARWIDQFPAKQAMLNLSVHSQVHVVVIGVQGEAVLAYIGLIRKLFVSCKLGGGSERRG